MGLPLEGRKALVTGARRNIGRGIAQALADAGCDVGINDRVSDDEAATTLEAVREAGRQAGFFGADVASASEVADMVAAFVDRFGRIDILVNNAYAARNAPFLEIPESAWDHTIDVCLKGYFLCAQAAGRAMSRQQTGGAIVNISSVHARRAWPSDTCYGVAKAGILRLTESVAVELAEHGIRCNSILPGYMDTDRAFGTPPPARGSAPERLHRFIPTRRYGTPEDVGRAAVFLCSEQAATITGTHLSLDGGLLCTGVP